MTNLIIKVLSFMMGVPLCVFVVEQCFSVYVASELPWLEIFVALLCIQLGVQLASLRTEESFLEKKTRQHRNRFYVEFFGNALSTKEPDNPINIVKLVLNFTKKRKKVNLTIRVITEPNTEIEDRFLLVRKEIANVGEDLKETIELAHFPYNKLPNSFSPYWCKEEKKDWNWGSNYILEVTVDKQTEYLLIESIRASSLQALPFIYVGSKGEGDYKMVNYPKNDKA